MSAEREAPSKPRRVGMMPTTTPTRKTYAGIHGMESAVESSAAQPVCLSVGSVVLSRSVSLRAALLHAVWHMLVLRADRTLWQTGVLHGLWHKSSR